MVNKISEDTQVQLDLKTIGIIVTAVIAIATSYLTLKNDIKKASDKSEEAITKIEFNISQEAVKQIIRETQTMMHGGHTTMYQMLEEKFRKQINDSKKEIIEEIRR